MSDRGDPNNLPTGPESEAVAVMVSRQGEAVKFRAEMATWLSMFNGDVAAELLRGAAACLHQLADDVEGKAGWRDHD